MLKLLKGEKWTGQKSASTAYFTWGWVEWLVFFVSHSPLHWVFCFMQGSIFTWRPISSWKIKKQVLRGEGQDSKTLKLSHFFCQSLISPSRMGTFSVWRMPGGWFYFFFFVLQSYVRADVWRLFKIKNMFDIKLNEPILQDWKTENFFFIIRWRERKEQPSNPLLSRAWGFIVCFVSAIVTDDLNRCWVGDPWAQEQHLL